MTKYFIPLFVAAICLTVPVYAGEHKERREGGKRMEKFDTNADGYISKDEMLEAHKKRIDKMFQEHDKDADGKLSKEELRASKKAMKERFSNRRDKFRERKESTE